MTGRSLLAAMLLLAGTPAVAAPFTLSSTSFQDGAVLGVKHAGNLPTNPNCIGQNVSPQLSWTNLPEGTRSLTFLMVDPEGRNGLSTAHWVAYGVPTTKTSFAEGEVSRPAAGYLAGKTTQGINTYGGPCTPPDTTWHHYTFIAIATDLAPDAIPAGLTWDELKPKLEGHAKGSAGLMGRFRKP